MAKMDDTKNRMIFEAMQEVCEWKHPIHRTDVEEGAYTCMVGVPCNQKNCMPLHFCIYFNRPEINHG